MENKWNRRFFKMGLGGGLTAFFGYLYYVYQKALAKKFEREWSEMEDKSKHLMQIHTLTFFHRDRQIMSSDLQFGILKLRKALLSLASGKVLETNVGSSNNLRFYDSQKVTSVDAVDYCDLALEQAVTKETSLPINYHLQNCEQLKFKDSSFDSVVDTFGLNYCYNPRKVLSEMRRVCKDDGLILLLVSSVPQGKWWETFYRLKQPIHLGQYGRFTMRNWNKIFEQEKLDVLVEESYCNNSVKLYVIKNSK